jgi:hypothetical protein
MLNKFPYIGPRLQAIAAREKAVQEREDALQSIREDLLHRADRIQSAEEELGIDAEGNIVPVIEFFCEPQFFGVVAPPVNAAKHIAEWYKKIPPTLDKSIPGNRDQFGAAAMTAKKCMPLIDGMSLGYTMLLAGDLHVRANDTGSLIEVHSGGHHAWGALHSASQLGDRNPTYPSPAVKFHNPWAIRTRPGWSTLFISPMNHDEERFQCLGAVVDTDTYPKQVNFPALWFARDFDDVLPAGTPLVTAIPFRRADVPKEMIVRLMREDERQEIGRMERVQSMRSHMYTKELRAKR